LPFDLDILGIDGARAGGTNGKGFFGGIWTEWANEIGRALYSSRVFLSLGQWRFKELEKVLHQKLANAATAPWTRVWKTLPDRE
jgi:hypothetical protein